MTFQAGIELHPTLALVRSLGKKMVGGNLLNALGIKQKIQLKRTQVTYFMNYETLTFQLTLFLLYNLIKLGIFLRLVTEVAEWFCLNAIRWYEISRKSLLIVRQ
jgi:hypothetical protein